MNGMTSSPPQDLWKEMYKVSKQIMRKINAKNFSHKFKKNNQNSRAIVKKTIAK